MCIRNAIGTIDGAGGYVDVAPLSAKSPYYVVSLVSGRRDFALAGPTGGRSGVYQVDVYASTYTDASSIAERIIERAISVDAFSVGGVSDLPDDYSIDTGDFRIGIEFSVQF